MLGLLPHHQALITFSRAAALETSALSALQPKLELAKPLEKQFDAKLWPDLIIRHRATQQMRQMTRRQRQKNVANSFSLAPKIQKSHGNCCMEDTFCLWTTL